ncbi:hypothetical protein MHK71_01600 [Kocuria indica]|uniref:hypothetical protein n=1 Tax=Kocuria marina TaxID=223184 RepID=UPI001EF444B7|nr:hypothetical protein [Kocuria indica]MCG7431218.1 hypothetical protein [Kocuria indica]
MTMLSPAHAVARNSPWRGYHIVAKVSEIERARIRIGALSCVEGIRLVLNMTPKRGAEFSFSVMVGSGQDSVDRAVRDALGRGVIETSEPDLPLAGSSFGGQSLAVAVLSTLSTASRDILELAGCSPRERFEKILHVFLDHAGAVSSRWIPAALAPAPAAYLSFHSHAQGFAARSTDPDAIRHRMAATSEALAPYLLPEASRTLDRWYAVHQGEREPPAQGWGRVVHDAVPGLTELAKSGLLTVDDDQATPGPLDESDFHIRVRADRRLSNYLQRDPRFIASRLATSLLYHQAYALGFTLEQRFLACAITARLIERGCGITEDSALRFMGHT